MIDGATSRTTTQLLVGLRDARNAEAWGDLDARYRPVLLRLARRFGFAGDDADELAQQTLSEFSRSYSAGGYDRDRGRLRSWMIGIARNVARSMRRGRPVEREGGDSRLEEVADDTELSRAWDEERDQAIFVEALRRIREQSRTDERTLRAFEEYAIHGQAVEEVAQRHGLTIDSVYVVKNRLTKRLREIVGELTAAYSEGE